MDVSRRTAFWFLVGILIIATFFRSYQFTSAPPGLYPDEAMNGNNALEALQTNQEKLYYPENNGREGLFVNIQAEFLRIFLPFTDYTPEPWMLRVPSALFGILTVLGMYFLGKELFSRNVGLLAAFFMATGVWHIIFSRIAFRAILAPFFLVWAMYFYLSAVKSEEHHHARHRAKLVLAGICFGLGFYTYIAYRIAPLLLVVIAFAYRKFPHFWTNTLIFLTVTFLTALPIGAYYLANPADFFGRTTQVSVFAGGNPLGDLALNIVKTAGMFNVAGDFNWRHNIAGSPELWWPVGLLFLAGIWLGIRHLVRRRRHAAEPQELEHAHAVFGFVLLFAWLAVMALPVVISNEGLPHALRAILMAPPAYLLAAVGAEWALYRARRAAGPKAFAAAGTLLAFAFIAQAYAAYFNEWARNPETPGAFTMNLVDLGRTLRQHSLADPAYVIVDAGGVPVRGIPMPAQTPMYLTNTFPAANRAAHGIFYLLPGDASSIPADSAVYHLQ